MSSARSEPSRKVTAAALLATASLIALLCGMPGAAANDCAGVNAAPPANAATPSMLYDSLRARTSAQLLAMEFLRKPVANECAWIYQVKVVTASGSVVELDFDATGLDLVGARGPENDRDADALVKRLGGDAAFLTSGASKTSKAGGSGTASNNGKGSSGGSGGGNAEGEGGEGGNSGSDSGGGGEGGGSGGSGSGGGGGDDGGGGSGGDGSGEGGDSSGEGGDD
jgi:hypothetical protein